MSQESRSRVDTLAAAVDELVAGWPGVSRKTMFGCPSYVADGVLFAVVSEQGLSLTRLSDAERAKLARSLSVEPFEARGRLVRKWATVGIDPDDIADPDDADAIAGALRRSYEAAVV
jgi:hypothetical protein